MSESFPPVLAVLGTAQTDLAIRDTPFNLFRGRRVYPNLIFRDGAAHAATRCCKWMSGHYAHNKVGNGLRIKKAEKTNAESMNVTAHKLPEAKGYLRLSLDETYHGCPRIPNSIYFTQLAVLRLPSLRLHHKGDGAGVGLSGGIVADMKA
ncbi:MAG: hypothetical protein WAV20_19740, partial [Blastocatellia bacterium]